MSYWHAFILSIVEGVTEFLPVSSTGHLILVSKLMGIQSSEFHKSFEIIIQLGAIAAVLVVVVRKVIVERYLLGHIFLSFAPTAIVGAIMYPFIKRYLLDNPFIVAISLILGGLVLLAIEKNTKVKKTYTVLKSLSPKKLLVIGLIQSLAFIPGVSRSAATIIAGIWVGLSRQEAVYYSFLLAIPTMLGATILDITKSSMQLSSQEIILLVIGLLGSFTTALLTIHGLVRFIVTHSFMSFGLYRIVLGSVTLLWLLVVKDR